MSRISPKSHLSLWRINALLAMAVLPSSFSGVLIAQDDRLVTSPEEIGADADEPVVIDILAPIPQSAPDPIREAECTRAQEAALLSGQIIVCAPPRNDDQFRTLSRDDAQRRYAEETAYKDDPQAPDLAGAGIFRGPATIGGMCLVPPCPPPKAIIIDVEALPEAPPGSDADRIGRGLPPRGRDASSIPTPIATQAEAGPILDYAVPVLEEVESNPEESAEPEDRP